MAKTDAELLDEIDAAISSCLTSQELRGPHGSVVRAQLRDLWAMRKEVKERVEAAAADSTTGGFVNKVQFGRPV
jgi:hypothetical protein